MLASGPLAYEPSPVPDVSNLANVRRLPVPPGRVPRGARPRRGRATPCSRCRGAGARSWPSSGPSASRPARPGPAWPGRRSWSPASRWPSASRSGLIAGRQAWRAGGRGRARSSTWARSTSGPPAAGRCPWRWPACCVLALRPGPAGAPGSAPAEVLPGRVTACRARTIPAAQRPVAASAGARPRRRPRRGARDAGQPLGRILGVGGVELHRLVVGRLDVELPVPRHARPGRDQLADDDVLLEPEQPVGPAVDGGLREHPGGLLERRRGQPRLGGQRGLGDAHDLGPALGRAGPGLDHRLVHLPEHPLVDPLAGQEVGVARLLHADAARSSGARSARCACRGSTRPGPGRPSGPLRPGTAGSRGRP